ncbi:MAG: Rne/Rng family ribonuclease, partial [Bryobacteraceae bacterium]
MSKELIVSSSRHETRVAVLEDDQLVEVYHQREHEYSLAGSVHKGRVTRVLPGMQSAFVDIGLERDAFLYVSDFFEDNEEYDAVVSTVEDKVLRMERGEVTPIAVAAPVVIEAPAEPPVAEAAAPVAPVVAAAPTAPVERDRERTDRGARDSRDNRESRDSRDGRGRRNRRRRGRTRGLPESKFAAAPEAASPVAPSEAVDDDDIIVLPGESLAKYSRPGDEPSEFPFEEPAEQPALRELTQEETEEILEAVHEVAVEAQVEHALGGGQREQPTEPPFAARALEPVPAREPGGEPAAEIAQPVEPDALLESNTAAPAFPDVEEKEGEDEEPGDAADSPEEAESGEPLEGQDGEEAPAESEAGAPGDEGPEPARQPTSLTATLREQGGRYPHRVSRRMRRRMRTEGGQGPGPGQGPASPSPRPLPEAAEKKEVQAPVLRQQAPKPAARVQASIADLLKEGQEIIVQIAKEPLGQKGARITSYVALPGRFVVYMPTVDHVGVSRKISSDEERQRLKRILQTNRQGIPGGFILRTAGEGQTEADLRADMMFLYNLWLDIRQKAEKRKAPVLVYHDLDLVQRVLRDQLTANFKNIWVDSEEVYEEVVQFVQRFQPMLVGRVKLYTRSTPIFDSFNITSEMEKALRPKVWLKSGGYIVINQTEALVAIDVNTGKFVGKSNRLEDTIVKTNTDAIKEIVRQIRLRDLGGIIVVDFIDMDERKNRQKVMQSLEEAMRSDRAPYKILSFNDFGLVAITRKRVKQSLERTLCAPCPYCEGAGYVKGVQTIISEILDEAKKIAPALDKGDVTLRVNPEIAKVL